MRSWLFRHRLRLRAVYAARTLPDRALRPRRHLGPDRDGLLPGACARVRGRYVIRPPGRAA
ncbi:MAG: hypothetical protein JNK02_11520 [Planctomycetes bacterium]|nr:hypothetical protein [Planctomycetota bacterium]